jgi:nucleotide-binding universal stress UspA family protein
MLVNKILLPVDGSAHARQAAEYAAELAGLNKAAVVLMHAYGDIPMILGHREDVIEEMKAESHKLLAIYAEALKKAGISFTESVHKGSPAEAILNVVREEKCDLIILGAKGHSELEDLVLGSVSHKVLHTADCPVLIVR